MKKYLLAGVALILIGGPTLAADVAYEPAPHDWTGFYAGIGGGFLFASADAEAEVFDAWFGTGNSVDGELSDSSGFLTGEIGADFQIDNIVIGAFANYDKSLSDASDRQSPAGPFLDSEVTWGDSMAIGARVGVLLDQQTLLYGLGGYSRMKINASSDSFNDGPPDVLEAGGWQNGWTAGAGVERLITNNLSIKAEYRYARYSGFDASDTCHGICDPGDLQSLSVDDSGVHAIRAVISFRFGGN